MVPFAGYLMPLSYTGQIAEHRVVRAGVGLFDISHMGEFRVRGPDRLRAVDRLVTNRIHGTEPGQAVYSPMCRDDGGIVDDLIVYHLPDSVLLVVNAANIAKDEAWIRERLPSGVEFRNESDGTSLLAIQGPRAEPVLTGLTGADLSRMGTYTAVETSVSGVEVLLSRTGYTGEDGFELYVSPSRAPELWDRLLEAGGEEGISPIGLAARDTLRFEMGYCLYGNDIDETTTPLEAGLGWTVRLADRSFVGSAALAAEKETGSQRRLVGLVPEGDRIIPRPGCPLRDGEEAVGKVTSGTFSPTLNRGLALGYVEISRAEPDRELYVEIRGRRAPVRVARLPFYRDGSRKRF